jgi:hypothetical protein
MFVAALGIGALVIGTDMQRKIQFALWHSFLHHFIEGFASRLMGIEDPGTLGATPTPKSLSYDPN